MSDTTHLIPVQRNAEGEATINARDLHEFLEVGKDFSNWIKDRIAKFEFVENQDFVCSPILASKDQPVGRGGYNRLDYHLTLDMAKEMAMIERTPKGKEARQYFIACEKEYRRLRGDGPSIAPKVQTMSERYLNGLPHETVLAEFKLLIKLNQFSPGMDANQAFLGAVGQMEVMGVQLRPLLAPQALALESPHRYAELRPTDMARRFGILRRDGKEDPAAVNRLLADLGYQTHTSRETLAWTPTGKGWPFAVVKDVPRATVQGGRPVRQLFWKETLLEKVDIQDAFVRMGCLRMQKTSPQISLELH